MPTTRGRNSLLPSLRQEVAQRVLRAGFAKGDFEFEAYAGPNYIDVTALTLGAKPEFLFVFYPDRVWEVQFSPGERMHTDHETPGDWNSVLGSVDRWLGYLRRELNVTDPWAAFFESEEPFMIGGDEGDNSPFTNPEREAISAQLAEFKTFLLDEGVKSDQDRHQIIAAFGRIEAELTKRGRADWRTFALGALMELALIGYATPEGVRRVVDVLIGSVQALIQ